MIRLKDIAARAGVSVMTVSKALRDAPDISEATKQRIRALAQQMGYTPNASARGLRCRSSSLLGVVIPASTHPILARMLLAIEEVASQHGFDIILHHTRNEPEREQVAIRRLLSRRVDGLLIAPVYRLEPSAPVYDELARAGVPTVLLGHRAAFCRDFVSVETDDLEASYTLTRHLLELGHRQIAFLAGPTVVPAAQLRLDGWRRALREAQIEPDDRLVFHAGSTIEEGQKAAAQLLQEAPQVTAIQAHNDLVAIGAGTVLLNQGLRIPQDISLVGFGNILSAEHFRVPLTTARQPKWTLGIAAMDLLLRLLRRERVESRQLPCPLIVRASTGPARQAQGAQAPSQAAPPPAPAAAPGQNLSL
jgi:LacI family transcriptional regulator